MPRTPQTRRGVPYQEAMDVLRQVNLILVKISATPRLPRAVRVEIQRASLLIAVLLTSDNGRSR